jgi:hypothetical protein
MEIPNKPNQTPSQIKFSDSEMKELSDIRESYEKITTAFGQLYLQKRELDNNERRVQEELEITEKAEKALLQRILEKYGEGTVDPNSGVFTPKK